MGEERKNNLGRNFTRDEAFVEEICAESSQVAVWLAGPVDGVAAAEVWPAWAGRVGAVATSADMLAVVWSLRGLVISRTQRQLLKPDILQGMSITQ